MALVPVEPGMGPGMGSGVMLEQLTEILFDLVSAMGLYQGIRGEVKGHEAAKINSELESLARILMNDSARANEIIRAYSAKRDDIVQSLIGSSPVGSRIDKMRAEYRKLKNTVSDAEKRVSENTNATDQLSSFQRNADNMVSRYGKSLDQKMAREISSEAKDVATRDDAINTIKNITERSNNNA